MTRRRNPGLPGRMAWIGGMRRAVATQRRWALMVPLLTALGSCSGPTDACTPSSDVTGHWQYRAIQSAPVAATSTGVLMLDGDACGRLRGAFDVIEASRSGVTRRLAGDVTGRSIGVGTVQFDVLLAPTSRRHLATVRGDSLAGTWLEPTEGGASGTFTGWRERGQ